MEQDDCLKKIIEVAKGEGYYNGESLNIRIADIQFILDEYYDRNCDHCQFGDTDNIECENCTPTWHSMFKRKENESWHVIKYYDYYDENNIIPVGYITTEKDSSHPNMILKTGTYEECKEFLDKLNKEKGCQTK